MMVLSSAAKKKSSIDFTTIELEDDTAFVADGGDNGGQEDDTASTPVTIDPQDRDLGGKPHIGPVEGQTSDPSPDVTIISPSKTPQAEDSSNKAKRRNVSVRSSMNSYCL